MNVLIIEDEDLASDRLEELLAECDPKMKVLAKIKSVTESVKWLNQHSTDLIFLDIQLSDGLSFNIFQQVEIDTPIIFTTAYDQYALKAFHVNSIAYLLKPIRKQDLISSLEKLDRFKKSFQPDIESLLTAYKLKSPNYKQRFLIKIGDKLKKIETNEIAYFHMKEGSVFLKTRQNMDLPTDYALDTIENQIDPSLFFRINRKYLIHVDSIKNMVAWSRSRIKLELHPAPDDAMNTIVSIERSSDFKNWLNR